MAHSMGVTYARRVIKGGFSFAEDEPYYIGPPLTEKVNTFIGMAGLNWGASSCSKKDFYDNFRFCNKLNGFYPGTKDTDPMPYDISLFLRELNTDPTNEG